MEPKGTFRDCRARQARSLRSHCTQRGSSNGQNRGIISTTQDAISDVAGAGIEGARSIAGSAADAAAGAANSAAKAVTGAALTAVRRARRLVGPAKKRKTVKRRAKAKKAKAAKKSAKRRPAEESGREIGQAHGAAQEEIGYIVATYSASCPGLESGIHEAVQRGKPHGRGARSLVMDCRVSPAMTNGRLGETTA